MLKPTISYNYTMKLRRVLIILGLLGLSALLLTNLGGLHKFFDTLQHVQWYIVPLLVGVQLISYLCNAKYYQAFFAVSHAEVPLSRLYEISLAINFANQAIPAGGVAGTTYLTQAVKPDIAPGTATLAQLGRYVFTFLSHFPVLAVGFLLLFFGDSLEKISVRLTILAMLFVLALGVVLVMIFSERRRLEHALKPFIRLANSFGRIVLRRPHPVIQTAQLEHFLDEFYDGYHRTMRHKGQWLRLFGWALGGNLAEIFTVYAVFIGFGTWPNPGIVITAYTLGIMVSVLGIFTNGVGVYEAGLIGTLSALGIPIAQAFAVVIVYRGLNLGIFLPVGLVYYRKYLKPDSHAARSH
jgi:uncharacterized protein (TIRG00374 family)